ncbi:MAG TPA: hypothetical protein VNA14_07690 [Mycobacteriales bacterium]|nr:hypothetical protein [Mycobacteriales bacterium]
MTDGPVAPSDPDDLRRMPAGVRANALAAEYFTLLREVDHRIADAVLDSLEDAGVAAYVEPAPPADREGYTQPRFTTPQDRLYVDCDRRDAAGAVVSAELPGMLAEVEPVDHDAAFDEIVAGWDSLTEAEVPPWPVTEDLDVTLRDPSDDLPRSLVVGVPEDDDEPAAADEGHFVPPPPPPLPRPDYTTKLAVAAIVSGFLVLFVLPTFGSAPGQGMQLMGVAGILGGIATLISRLRDGPSVDDGPDDGAVV